MARKDIMTVSEAAEKWGITKRRVQEIIREGKIDEKYRKEMYLIGKAWVMPADTPKPPDLRKEPKKADKKE